MIDLLRQAFDAKAVSKIHFNVIFNESANPSFNPVVESSRSLVAGLD